MNLLISFWLVAFMWQNVHAQYGASCIEPENLSGKCVPIASCKNIDERLKNIIATGESIPPDFRTYLQKSYCGFFDNARHVCCEENEIQYNANSMAILKKLKCGRFSTGSRFEKYHKINHWKRPWMAILGYNRSNVMEFRCGGTLISDRYVLTAAHCVAGLEDELKVVRLGEHKISEKIECVTFNRFKKRCFEAIDVSIDKMIVHENFEGDLYDDIALLRLSDPLDLNDSNLANFISPICLPITDELKNEIHTIDVFSVSGWGTTENNTTADVLTTLYGVQTTVEKCNEAYNIKLRDSQLCVDSTENEDPCNGYSGGPLQAKSAHMVPFRFVQFGIVSLGHKKCGTPLYPTIYTNVAYYIQWITDKMAGN